MGEKTLFAKNPLCYVKPNPSGRPLDTVNAGYAPTLEELRSLCERQFATKGRAEP